MEQEPLSVTTALLFLTPNGEAFEVPVEGSLGLLALGYVGLMAWRQKRNEVMQQQMAVHPPENNEALS